MQAQDRDAGAPPPPRLRARSWCAALLLCAMAWWPGAAFAQANAAEGASPRGEARIGKAPRDPDFGVSTRQAGLQRHVEMYQWARAGGGYALQWRGARVDSSGFAPGHENPREMPLREREWRAPVSIDGRPVPEDVVAALGKWQSFRPNFSALPGNMSATFQPEGDGLGSAENPLAPRVGDLRVTWRELVLPPLAGLLVLRDGQWALAKSAAPRAVGASVDSTAAAQVEDRRGPRWPFVVAPAIVLLIMAVAVRRRRSRT
jgi:transmembrane protein TMEM43